MNGAGSERDANRRAAAGSAPGLFRKRRIFALALMVLVASLPQTRSTVIASPETMSENGAGLRSIWVWRTGSVIADKGAFADFVAALQAANVTDIYLYLRAADYRSMEPDLKFALGVLHNVGINVWGLEGYRGYFSDMYGSNGLYKAADSLIAYNGRVAPDQRFVGFMSDLEPQDLDDSETPRHFHNGTPGSRLTARQSAERTALMRDWLGMHKTLSERMRGADLRYGATMVSWIDDYFGEEVRVEFGGVITGVMKHLMPLVDDYVVMSYNTNPENAAKRARGEVIWADETPGEQRVFAAIETHAGAGAKVSYGDTPGKDSRRAVLGDIGAIERILGSHDSFAGVAIHDWAGWNDLRAAGDAFGRAD